MAGTGGRVLNLIEEFLAELLRTLKNSNILTGTDDLYKGVFKMKSFCNQWKMAVRIRKIGISNPYRSSFLELNKKFEN